MPFTFDIAVHDSEAPRIDGLQLRTFIQDTLRVDRQKVFIEERPKPKYFDTIVGNVSIADVIVNVPPRKQSDSELYSSFIIKFCRDPRWNPYLLHVSPEVFLENPLFQARLRSRDHLNLSSASFGTFIELKQFRSHLTIGKGHGFGAICTEIAMEFQHDRRRCILKVQNHSKFHFEIPYSALRSVTVSSPSPKMWHLYIALDSSPLLYEVKQHPSYRPGSDSGNGHLNDADVEEANDSARFYEEGDDSKEPLDFKEEEWVIKSNKPNTVGTVYMRRTTFDPSVPPELLVKCNVIRLEFPRAKEDPYYHWRCLWSICRNISRFASKPVYIGRVLYHNYQLDYRRFFYLPNIPFNVQYAFECIQCHSFTFSDQLFRRNQVQSFYELVFNCAAEDALALENAFYDLHKAIDEHYAVDYLDLLRRRFQVHRNAKKGDKSQVMPVRRCIFTPSRVLFLPPLYQLQSRFLRNSSPDYALRVYIRDDDLGSLQFNLSRNGAEKHKKLFLEEKIYLPLSSGIRLFDRVYQFLGSSASQLRDIGAVFYATDLSGRTSESVLSQIGDVSNIQHVGKRICRIGQYFSQSMTYVEVPKENVIVIDDILGGPHEETGESYIFSDGIGMISLDLATEVTKKLSTSRVRPYSAYQIRYAGAKGMLCVNPELKGRTIVLRKSMMKFESDSSSLEILKISEARTVYLNRQIICILEALGVPRETFLQLEREAFLNIFDSFVCCCKSLEVVRAHSLLRLDISSLADTDIDFLAEPLFQGILCLAAKQIITKIRTKAQVPLPLNKAKMAFGVLDEYRVLEEGEVFVQFSKDKNGLRTEIIEGTVMVLRHPCMHPGDVRKFKAVNRPELHHIVDCVVFPQVGARPHPDELSGGDLDGDEFAVIWFNPVVFAQENHAPMVYPRQKAAETSCSIALADMLHFYIEFMNSVAVGKLANAHLAFADGLPKGVLDEKCVELAQQYALALDFTKTGCAPENVAYRPRLYPDFMEKQESEPSYISKRVLGEMFWLCDDIQENTIIEPFISSDFSQNEELLTYPGWWNYEKQAETEFEDYCYRISLIAHKFGVESELALISGIYSRTDKYICGSSEKSDVKLIIDEMVKEVFKTLRQSFIDGLMADTEQQKMAKASAWYLVSKRRNRRNEIDKSPSWPYYAFPWILSDILCQIANLKSPKLSSKHNCLLKSRDALYGRTFEDFLCYLRQRYPELEAKGIVSFTGEKVDPIYISKENLTTVVLSLQNASFRTDIHTDRHRFLNFLQKDFGVGEITCEIYGQAGNNPGNLYVTFTGNRENVKRLKKGLMKKDVQTLLSNQLSNRKRGKVETGSSLSKKIDAGHY